MEKVKGPIKNPGTESAQLDYEIATDISILDSLDEELRNKKVELYFMQSQFDIEKDPHALILSKKIQDLEQRREDLSDHLRLLENHRDARMQDETIPQRKLQ